MVNEAIRDARSRFPFPQILDDTADTIRTLATVLRKFAPTRSRLLHIGCGVLDKAGVFQQLGYLCFACDDFQDSWHRHQGNPDPVLRVFVALYGRPSSKAVSVTLEEPQPGIYRGVAEDFAVGFVSVTDVAIDSKGHLYIADYGGNQVYRVSWIGDHANQ